MKKGFIIFSDINYFDIVDNLITSVLLFSKYDIEFNCINFIKEYSNPRIKCKQININNHNFFNITKCKLISSINTDFDLALLLDGDMIVTPEIDNIFIDNEDIIVNKQIPLFCKHPHNPFMSYEHIFKLLGMNKTPKMKYVYSVYMFTKTQIWFFQKALDIMNNISFNNTENLYYPIPEESVLNYLLSEYEVDYDMGYCYHINGFEENVEYYLNPLSVKEICLKGKKSIEDTYLNCDCPVKIYAFHGHKIKDVNYGKKVIEKMKKMKNENYKLI